MILLFHFQVYAQKELKAMSQRCIYTPISIAVLFIYF